MLKEKEIEKSCFVSTNLYLPVFSNINPASREPNKPEIIIENPIQPIAT